MGNLLSKDNVLLLEAAYTYAEGSFGDTQKKKGKKGKRNRHRLRGHALVEMDKLSEEDFSRMFRMSRTGFNGLLTLIEPFLPVTDVGMAELSSGSAISNSTKLAVTLRWLAGGSYLDICFAWGVSKASFFSDRGIVWPVLESIDKAIEIGLPINDIDALQKIASDFSIYSHGTQSLSVYIYK